VSDIVVGTGHRPDKLLGYSPAARQRVEAFAEQCLRDMRPAQLITGMAQGWDQALAVAAVKLGIPFLAAVPCDGQESVWPEPAQVLYRSLLAKAGQVVVVSPGAYAGWKMQKRNEFMVDAGTEVLALWNGSDGGTANCVHYAMKKKVPITNVWPQWLKALEAKP
jgi:uncharacterized phage-like protein YoqJ